MAKSYTPKDKYETPNKLQEFSDPRLVAFCDTLNPFGDDGEFFCKQAEELSAKPTIDLGCGTGLLTFELAKRGHQMTGIKSSEAVLAVARVKPYADKINGYRINSVRSHYDELWTCLGPIGQMLMVKYTMLSIKLMLKLIGTANINDQTSI